ncbi:insulinase family protein [Sporosarcina sp. BI001-red]|uniref:EF-P 5-aminopentanol modification-associated protein YfmF n=1 Tax=Sporosarcina sp. BI001-red TaxID=2282866 RepID=UPI000E22764C|nr:pitrilysin family protein [Sporosarcina sp. BI001-red]REB09814.1 insulinase family protein [Sporosarcina sp. BI001-red]
MFLKTELQSGVNLYTRQTAQFKTVSVAIKFTAPLTEENAASRTVLANVLEDSSAQYPTRTKLRQALEELYGAVYYADTGKRGNEHIFTIYAESVNEEYLRNPEVPVFEQLLALVTESLFKPNLTDGVFDEAIVEREKQTVIDRIGSVYNDKTRFANKRMLELIRSGQPASQSASGTEKALSAITKESLKATYDQMLSEDTIDIYILGDVDTDQLTNRAETLFPFTKEIRNSIPVTATTTSGKAPTAKHIRERQDMKQGKLNMAFSTPVGFNHPDYPKMQMMNGVLGGFAHSKLFINVREKESLAYYCSSSYASHYGLLYIMSGIDAEQEEKTAALINQQIEALRNGDISDLEIRQTLALLSNSIRSSFDSAKGQIEIYDQYKLLDENFSADKLIRNWERVTKEDIQEMATLLTKEITYLLSGREAMDHE